MVFWWIPIDISQGPVQKLYLFMKKIVWCSMVAIILVSIASIIYLAEKKSFWIRFKSTAEIGVILE